MFGLKYIKDVTTISIDGEKCTGCRQCVTVCPHAVLQIVGKKSRVIYKDDCMECGACQRNCESGAIQVQSGVGCANALINAFLRGNTDAACCNKGGCC